MSGVFELVCMSAVLFAGVVVVAMVAGLLVKDG
jgi:hypothetical protein